MLTILSQIPDIYEYLPKTAIFTPHPGEMARLTRLAEEIFANRAELAQDFATEKGLTLVLKGANTIVASPNGDLRRPDFATLFSSPAVATCWQA